MNSCFVFPPYRSGSCSISTVLHFVSALSFPVVFLIRDSRAKSEGLYKNWIEQEYTAVDYRAASGCSFSALETRQQGSLLRWQLSAKGQQALSRLAGTPCGARTCL